MINGESDDHGGRVRDVCGRVGKTTPRCEKKQAFVVRKNQQTQIRNNFVFLSHSFRMLQF